MVLNILTGSERTGSPPSLLLSRNTTLVSFDTYSVPSMKKTALAPLKEWALERGLSYSSALKYIQEGRLNAQRLGRYWYVVKEVEAPGGDGVVLTLFTHAGGAGKTSPARDLGYEMASRGKQVLLVDVDPQANLRGAFPGAAAGA